jgi:hypothetical protein
MFCRRLFQVLFCLVITLVAFSPSLAAAQSVTYRLTITQIKPMELDRCNEMDHYVWLSLGGLPPGWQLGDETNWKRINPVLDQEDPNRPGPPACVYYAPHPTPRWEDVSGVFYERTLSYEELGVEPISSGQPFPGPNCPSPTSPPPIKVIMELWDRDNAIGGNDDELGFRREIEAAQPTGVESCIDRGSDGGMCWKLEATATDTVPEDSDGDGLPDIAELNGVDINCDGLMSPSVDLPLHLMGVTVGVKDMLVEVNWFFGDGSESNRDHAPLLDTLVAVKNAFARAPDTAGGVHTPGLGINIIFDTGGHFEDNVDSYLLDDIPIEYRKGGRNLHVSPSTDDTGACDSLVRRPCGSVEGYALPVVDPNVPPTSRNEARTFACHHDTPSRRGYFRHVLLGPSFEPGVGGIHLGNDRIYMLVADTFGREGARLMHELGHSLDLSHGGGSIAAQCAGLTSEMNCEPNNLSIMNYLYGSEASVRYPDPTTGGESVIPAWVGLPFEDAGSLRSHIDFSPPRAPNQYWRQDGATGAFIEVSLTPPDGCAVGNCNQSLLLPELDEACLYDGPLMADDLGAGYFWRHSFIRERADGAAVLHRVTHPVDWADDGIDATTCISKNLNSPSWWAGTPTVACQGTDLTTIGGVDEWSIIVIPPGRGIYGGSLDIVDDYDDVHPEVEVDLTEQFTVDLSVSVHGVPTPARVASEFEVVVTVDNHGPGRAYGGYVEVVLPEGVDATFVPETCRVQGERRYECRLVEADRVRAVGPGASVEFVFSLYVRANTTGSARYISVSATHEGPELNPSDNVVIVPISAQPAFLDFEDEDRPWVLAGSNGQAVVPTVSAPASSGNAAVQFDCGYTSIESPTFDTSELEEVGSALHMDVLIPHGQDPYWVGGISVLIDIPSAQIWNQHLSVIELTNLPRGGWAEVSVPLPSVITDILLGDSPDARFRMEVNVGGCGAPVGIDALRFGGDLHYRTIYHSEPSPPATVASSSVLTFDQTADWGSFQTTVGAETGNVTQGSAALSLGTANWMSVASRRFATTELAGVTDRLSFDIFIPDLPPDYYWFGGLNAFAECPSASMWKTFVGHQPLQILFDNEYNRIEFALPPHVVSVLEGDYSDCRFELEFSTSGLFDPILVDRGGFVQ